MERRFLFGFVILCGGASGWAEATNHRTVEELRQVRLPDVVIESLTPANPDPQKKANRVGYVDLKGIIGGHIRFELLLPDEWNGRLVMGGGGGFVGAVQNAARSSVNGGYATVATDTGHQSEPGYMAGWALDDLEAKVSFGYLAGHRTAEVAKALIRTRLFTVRGCLHCGGGPGATDVDWLSVVVDWVEHRKAPDRLIASKKEDARIVMTRPLYPYPECAIYKGSGDTNSAESFALKH